MRLATLATVVALAALLVAEYRGTRLARAVSKTLASTGFVATALAASPFGSAYGRAIVVALVFSWCGDLLLLRSSRRYLVGGMGAFLAAHASFVVAFLLRGTSLAWGAVALAGVGLASAGIGAWLLPKIEPRMRVPTAIYTVALSAMATFAAASAGARPRAPLLVVAAIAFYASDVSVAKDRLVAHGRGSFLHRAWGLPLYYAAELLFAWSIV